MKKKINNYLYKIILPGKKSRSLKVKQMSSRKIPYEIEVIAEKLNVPWAIDISNDGKIYFTERPGTIRVIENGVLNPNPLITFAYPFTSQSEGGLMGLALDPNYARNRYMYVMYSYLENNNHIFNRVVRLIERNGSASIDKILLDRIPGNQYHNGGRIKIGPDRKLYITTGDAQAQSLSQDISSLAGKILRIELSGNIPIDNPSLHSPVYSLGHRNPQGIAWGFTNKLYASEHGQSAHDEINIIVPEGNYGWPLVKGYEDSNTIKVEKPLIHSGEDTWAPSGITFINQGPWKNKLLVTALNGQRLLLISLNEDGTSVTNIESFFNNEYGRLRDVVQGRDGSIYIATSNRDGRGNPDESDDKIIRLVPK